MPHQLIKTLKKKLKAQKPKFSVGQRVYLYGYMPETIAFRYRSTKYGYIYDTASKILHIPENRFSSHRVDSHKFKI